MSRCYLLATQGIPKISFGLQVGCKFLRFHCQEYAGIFLTESQMLLKSECHGFGFERSHTSEKLHAPF